MKGTEKQIKWADQIKAKMMTTACSWKGVITHVATRAKKEELLAANMTPDKAKEMAEKAIGAVMAIDNAGWWIDNRQDTIDSLAADEMIKEIRG